MGDKNEFAKGPPSIIAEIEGQLEEILSKKRESVEKALEEKIKREEEEAKRRMDEIEQEMAAEKEALLSYRNILSEYEEEKAKIKIQVQKHLERAAEIQSDIEDKTMQTLEELNKVTDLNSKLEEINQETENRVVTLKEDLEKKYGISPTIPEYRSEEIGIRIESELAKLNKIKELLEIDGNLETIDEDFEVDSGAEVSSQEIQEEEVQDDQELAVQEPEAQEPEPEPEREEVEDRTEQVDEIETQMEVEEKQEEEVEIRSEEEDRQEEQMEAQIEEEKQAEELEDIAEEETELQTEEEEKQKEPAVDAVEGDEEGEFEAEIIRLDADEGEKDDEPDSAAMDSDAKASEQNLMKTLDEYRKSEGLKDEGEISYFENKDKLTLDGEYIIAAVSNNVDEAKKLYIQLSQTKSPKEQFFVKQEIIRHQEIIRKLMLSTIKICEKDSFFLPHYTQDILNVDVFKVILEKVSMENWSNQEDFNSFDEYARRLRDSFYDRITPPDKYLHSIMKELKIVV